MPLATKEEIFSTGTDPCAVLPLAADPVELEIRFGATTQLRKNSRQGFTRKNLALHQGSTWSNSGTALGIEPVLLVEGVRSRSTGKERDSESGLDNFGARYNSSQYGRFMSPDPKQFSMRTLLNPQKWNKYAYTINNPLRYFDPDGMEELEFQLRAVIQAQSRPDPAGRRFAGDNRGFSSAANASSRTTITVRIETDASIRPGNPIISVTPGSAGLTRQVDANGNTINSGTATAGLPTVSGSRDANGNAVLNFQQNVTNPLEPQSLTPGIRSNLDVTVPQNGSSVTTAGTVSGSPSFELNVATQGGADVNIPLQTEPSSNVGFGAGLFQNNSVFNFTPLPPPPPPCANHRDGPC
jgi:RHS repeat-associated protein